jgi:iron complex outermembrane receptor protein
MNSRDAQPRSIIARMKPLTLAVAAAVGSLPVAVTAQDTNGTGFQEELIVTATRRAESAQDVPINISAVSGDTLEQKRIVDLATFARQLPGLMVIDQGPRGGDVLTARGLNASSLNGSEFLDNSSGDTVGTYIGDIPLYLDMKLYDLERIEVLLGPQGTLYGAGTLAGAVRYIPRKPDTQAFSSEVHGQTYAMDESDDTGFQGDAWVNIPLIEDKLAVRGVFGYLDDPGFIDYNYLVIEPGVSNPQPDFNDPNDVAANLTRVKDVNDQKTTTARVALLWNITDNLESTLAYTYQKQESGGRSITHQAAFGDDVLGVPGAGADEYTSAHRFEEPSNRTNQLVTLELNWDLGFANLISATGYSDYSETGQRDQTDLLLNFEYGYESFPAFAAFTRDDSEENRFNQEIRLVSQGDGRLNWIGGVFYNNYDIDAISQEFTPGIPQFFGQVRPDNLEYIQLTDDDLEETAIFGEIGYQLTDRWQVTGGARYFEYENNVNVGVDLPLLNGTEDETCLNPNDSIFDPGCYQQNKVDNDDVIFKINTSYDFTENLLAFLTISEGYRIGGVNSFAECASVPPPPGQNVCLTQSELLIEPDKTLNYEIGMHSTWLDNRILFNASVYYIDWDKIQTASISQFGGLPITVNGSKANSQGLELSGGWQISDSWYVGGSYGYNQTELTEDAPGLAGADSTGTPVDAFDGDRLPGYPEHMGSLDVNFFQSLGAGLNLDVLYQATANSDILTRVGERNNGEALPGFAVHNLSVALSGERWTATLYSQNLANKYAKTGTRQDASYIRKVPTGDPNGFDMRRYFHNVLRPRTIGLDLRWRFGD